MTVEVSTYINTLNSTLPNGGDAKSEGDDHIRLVKANLKSTFPNVAGAVNSSHTELNALVGIAGSVVGSTNTQTLSNKTMVAPVRFSIGNVSTVGALASSGLNIDNFSGVGNLSQIGFGYTAAGANTNATAYVALVETSNTGNGLGDLIFGTRSVTTDTAPTERMRIDSTGAFGFNAAPSATERAVFGLTGNVPRIGLLKSGVVQWTLGGDGAGGNNFDVYANAGLAFRLSTTIQAIQDGAGNELGFKGLPAASVTTGAFAAADRGKCVNASAGVTVPNATMSATDVVYIDNQSGGAITITATITTLKLAGTTSTGNRTLAADGFATIRFRSGTVALISGPGVS